MNAKPRPCGHCHRLVFFFYRRRKPPITPSERSPIDRSIDPSPPPALCCSPARPAFPGALAQLSNCGSTFYASGYDANGNKDGLVLMQTLAGVVVDDGREVVACAPPGKYSAGSEVVIESKHVVDKPHGLDWERAAMLPYLVGFFHASYTRTEWQPVCASSSPARVRRYSDPTRWGKIGHHQPPPSCLFAVSAATFDGEKCPSLHPRLRLVSFP